MWFPDRIKEVSSVDIQGALTALETVTEEDWFSDDALKKKLAGARPTQSMFFYSISKVEMEEVLSERPLQQQDVPKMAAYEKLYSQFQYIFELVQELYPSGGVFLRAQLARMRPGTKIPEHRDATFILENTHRLHVPLITTDKLSFTVDDERVHLKEGLLYELNNQLYHSVDNPKDSIDRIHLIMDYLPPEYNSPESLSGNFKFHIKQHRAARAVKPSNVDVSLPKALLTSVVRGAHQSQSHGGIYLVDLEKDSVEQKVDWDTGDIDFEGRGADRGLRGIAYVQDMVVIAASDELFFYDQNFSIQHSFKNRYLKHAHEIYLDGRFLYVTSTGFDAVLRFNLRKKSFDLGWRFSADEKNKMIVDEFDPQIPNIIKPSNNFHINNTFYINGVLSVSGRRLRELVHVKNENVVVEEQIPLGTHNVQFFNKGIIYNDSESDRVVYSANYDFRCVDLPRYDEEKILNFALGDTHVARPSFGRGLCVYKKGTVLVGSSPSTVSLIDMKNQSIVTSLNITMDVRNAIHGLEVWPY